jgi:hypothetical protein
MAGLIDVGILKPELATSFATGYNQAEQQRNVLAQQKQQSELSQIKLDQLKQDQAMLTDLRTRLRAAGKSDDPNQFFQEMIRTGDPDYMSKGYEGLERYKALQRAEALLRKEAPELFGAAPSAAAPAAAPAPAAPSIMRMQPPAAATAPVNALGSGTFDPNAAPVNALAPAAAAPSAAPAAAPTDRARELRNKVLLYSSSGDPRLKAMADVYKAELQELTKPQTLGPGQQLYAGGKVIYTAPEKETDLQRNYKFAQTAAGGNFKGSFADFKVLSTPKTTTNITNVQEKAEAGEFGKLLVGQYDAISKQAAVAAKTLPSIEANLATLNKGLDTGFGTDAKAAGARVLGALGVKDAEKFATDTQTFQSNAISAVLQKQLEQKGPQTESDARRIEQIGVELGKTKDANRFILDLAREQLRRDIEQRNFYTDWKKGPGKGSFNGAEDAWFAGEGGKSLFDRPSLKKYAISASAASQIPGQRPIAPAANVVTNPQFPGFSIGK